MDPGALSYQSHTNNGFLLRETIEIASLLQQGKTWPEIQTLVVQENLLDLNTVDSRKTTFGALQKRLKTVPEGLIQLLGQGTLDSRKVTNYLLLVRQHRLLFEFTWEVLWEKHLQFQTTLSDVEVRHFRTRKHNDAPAVQEWSEATLQRSMSGIIRVLTQVGLLTPSPEGHRITPLFIPSEVRTAITQAGWQSLLLACLDQEAGR